jgi:SAM-dependent methyltransferase
VSNSSSPVHVDVLGLRSDREPATTLRYLRAGERIYVVRSESTARWFAQALAAGVVWVGLDGRPEGRFAVRLVEDESERASVEQGFRTKYSAEDWDRYFSASAEVLALVPGTTPGALPGIRAIRGEFDDRAFDYDVEIPRAPISQYVKDRTRRLIARSLSSEDPLIEIGPGTGYHTIPMLREGHHILAVDASPRMIAALRAAAESRGFGSVLSYREGSGATLANGFEDFSNGSFGGGFSAFGALNLEPEPKALAAGLARLIRPGGHFVFTSYNRPGFLPTAWELAAGRLGAAGARLREQTVVQGRRFPLVTHVRTPHAWDEIFSPWFRRTRTMPTSVLAPSFERPDLMAAIGTTGRSRLRSLDERLSRRPSLWGVGVWSLLEYERMAPASPSTGAVPPL